MWLTIAPDQSVTVKYILTDPELLNKTPNHIWKKDSSTLVLSSVINGLYVYKKKKFSVSPLINQSLANVFYSMILLPDNKTILANDYYFKDNQFVKSNDPFTQWDRYYNFKDHQGNYWLANMVNATLVKLDENFKNPVVIAKQFPQPNCMFEDSRNQLWVSFNHTLGLIINDRIQELEVPAFLQHPGRNEQVMCMAQDNRQNYWIGTRNGLYRSSANTPLELKEIDALKGLEVRSILCDTAGNIWVCTYGGGLYLLQQNNITNFNNAGNTLAFVHKIVEDHRGNFWLPTNNGIFTVNIQALLSYAAYRKTMPFFYRFTVLDGLRTNEFNLGGCINPLTGMVSLPSMNGIVSFRPDVIEPGFSQAPIVVENIVLDNTTSLASVSDISVPSSSNNIKVNVTTAFWGNIENSQLEYQLLDAPGQAVESNWIPIDQSNIISFVKPNVGSYKVLLRKRINLTASGFLYDTIYFKVMPQWYQSRLFYILSVLLLIFLIMAVYEWRLYLLRKKKVRLKEQISLATHKLQMVNNELNQQNRVKGQLISMFSHDISIPLLYITRSLKSQVENIPPDDPVRNNIAGIADSAGQLLTHTDNILNWIRVQQKHAHFKPDQKPLALYRLVNDKWQLLLAVAERKKIILVNQLTPACQVISDKDMLGVVVYNILSNAVKFTNTGSVLINGLVSGNSFCLKITDTGRGMSAADIYRINNYSMVRSAEGTAGEPGKGIGLVLVKELAAILRISIEIESTPGQGTTVLLWIPLDMG